MSRSRAATTTTAVTSGCVSASTRATNRVGAIVITLSAEIRSLCFYFCFFFFHFFYLCFFVYF